MTEGADVPPIELPFTCRDTDRHGNERWYVRLPGKTKVRIRAAAGSQEFIDTYWAVRSGGSTPAPATLKAKRGTFGWLVEFYYDSQQFAELDEAYTQVERRRHLTPLVAKIGNATAIMPRDKIRKAIKDRERSAARKWLAAVRHVYEVAVDAGLVDHDPTFGIKVKKPRGPGYHTWTSDEREAFEKFWAVGTLPRTAYAIGLYLGCRRSDAVRLGRQHERADGTEVSYTQFKGRNRDPVLVEHPIVAPLREALDARPTKGLLWLATAKGGKRSDKAFGGDFADWCAKAGLPERCTFHGLRKALATQVADGGGTTHDVNAVLGDKTLQQAEGYTRRFARKAAAKRVLTGMFGEAKPKPPAPAKSGTARGVKR